MARCGQQECKQVGRHAFAQRGARPDVADFVELKIEVHRVHHQERVFRTPWSGRRAQHPVLERTRCQRRKPFIDAGRVMLDQSALRGGQGVERLARTFAKSMRPVAPVQFERPGSYKLRHLAGGHAAQQIHLEIAILRLHEARAESDVIARAALDGRHAEHITFNADRRGQS